MDTIKPYEPQSHYQKYLDLVPVGDIITIIQEQQDAVVKIFQSVSNEKALYRYAPGKWSVKELFGHLIDSERIFSYRALCIGRHEKNPLPGWDQDDYIHNANFDDQTIEELINQFVIARMGFITLFQSFTTEALQNVGIANSHHLSPRLIARILFGHLVHHLNILRERYHISIP
ncbi:MAG TPA: DinB family protein [bacterium]|nr:DinB family protein [bacterium]HPN43319.1 DinB family protein [bacterium]